jgi:NAD(P)-dependent dehydrogenase (short-subunit alcohol dehydrogenase family)
VPRTIVITGASGGFGKLCVERFAAGGWDVVATVRKDTDLTAHHSKTRKART